MILIHKIGYTVPVFKQELNKDINNSKKKNFVGNPLSASKNNSDMLPLSYNNISFTGMKKSQSDKINLLKDSFTQNTVDLMNDAEYFAKKYKHSVITEEHFEAAALISVLNYMDDLDNGKSQVEDSNSYSLPQFFKNITFSEVFDKKEVRERIKPIIMEEIDKIDDNLSSKRGYNVLKRPALSESFANNIYHFSNTLALMGAESADVSIDPAVVLSTIYTTDSYDTHFKDFIFKIQESVMLSDKPKNNVHLNIYDEKAKNVLKNLSLGTNMFVLKDPTAEPKYLINSILDVFENQKKKFGLLNSENTEILLFNGNVKDGYFVEKIKDIAKNKQKNYIAVLNIDEMLINSATTVINESGFAEKAMAYSNEFKNLMHNIPENVKLIFIEGKNGYYVNMGNPAIKNMFSSFGEVYFPVMSTEQTKKAFQDQPLLMDKIETPYTKKAVDKVIELSGVLEGSYPQKAQKMLKKIDAYYAGKKQITDKDVLAYFKEAQDSLKVTGDDSSVDVIFDTGISLKNLLGKPATKKEAETIVKQIKSKKLGTKGAIIYSQDGSVGSGRKFTAKAIAGEVKAPYIEINALDFGTKDVSLFGGAFVTPEASIKKVFSLATAQAESNPNKAAVLFIENFEYFSVGEYVSEYHQKAMSQLLREMEKADRKGLNILVFGSVSNPDVVGDSTIKSFKFIDRIEVESPSFNIDSRKEILKSTLKKNHISLAGQTQEEKDKIIELMAETTKYFPYVYLVNLVKKAQTVAIERNHRSVDKADAVEAYLQLTTGRTSMGTIREHEKNIVASHECGHALTLEVMYNALSKKATPQILPDRVNFITLDPRGWYGGAMYPKDGPNKEMSIEKVIADIVCSYGGHSAEKLFYDMDGSWGITSDLEHVTSMANLAVRRLGQGYHTGKISVGGMEQEPSGRIKVNMDKDVDVITKNSLFLSDLITEVYADFNQEFTKKYAKLVGTGDCLIHGDVYRSELEKWKASQTPEKQEELRYLDDMILDAINSTKKGKIYGKK